MSIVTDDLWDVISEVAPENRRHRLIEAADNAITDAKLEGLRIVKDYLTKMPGKGDVTGLVSQRDLRLFIEELQAETAGEPNV